MRSTHSRVFPHAQKQKRNPEDLTAPMFYFYPCNYSNPSLCGVGWLRCRRGEAGDLSEGNYMASAPSSRERWAAVNNLVPFFFFLLLLFLVAPASCFSRVSSKQLALERAFPVGEELETVRSRDRTRHSRLLQQRLPGGAAAAGSPGIVDFSVEGSSNPFTVGLYYTRVKLGNPPKEFFVQIDTGSDVLWVNCNPCNGCPTTSGLNIELDFFDPRSSLSASTIPCSDQRCNYGFQPSEAGCATSSKGSLCGYTFQYGDGSGTSGFYVSDTMHFETFVADGMIANTSADIIFGCSDSQSGDLTKPDRAVDGIFGFGQHDLSVISQLSSLGVAPKVFSHCLKGSENGGGVLVLGEIIEPGIVYTPLVQYQPHYNLNLQSIAVNGQILPIDSSVFATSTTQGTIIDSGTTLAYLAEQAYDPFIKAIIASTTQSVQPFVSKGSQCFVTSQRVEDVFPAVTLNFEGRASLFLKPQDYLLQQGSVDSALIWCIGWQKNQGQAVTILGDLVLKDKIFVYDLAAQRIGWVNYDCSLSVNVSASSGRSEFLNTGQYKVNDSSHITFPHLILFVTAIFHVYISFFSSL